jgi:hypothetical protein
MDIWDTLIATYGLIISPIAGIRLVKLRMDTGLKRGKDMLFYLLFGFTNMAITYYTIMILPEGHWLTWWAGLILLFYLCVYGATQYQYPIR